ncbi:hypothetical protein [Spirosoma foliorum]|uniref:hypothetical protein n=1 Tax=Spirosoma foliorum TaxID=2710596 RepID=UPI001C70FB6D|nr:hypothetical protein [Spirosoma foliorum]
MSDVTMIELFAITANSNALQWELNWLEAVISTRFELYFNQESPYGSIEEIDEPNLTDNQSAYAQLVREHSLGNYERLMLIMALAPHIRPQVLDFFFHPKSYVRSGIYGIWWDSRQYSGWFFTDGRDNFISGSRF